MTPIYYNIRICLETEKTKPWKIITIAAVLFTTVALLTASALALWWISNPQASYSGYTETGTPMAQTPMNQAPLAQEPQEAQNIAGEEPPVLYTPPTSKVTVPANQGYGGWGWGGCMGNWLFGAAPYSTTTTTPLTITQASQIAGEYVSTLNNPDLQVTHMEEYTGNFYAEVGEKSTGYGAFELLINKKTGVVTPEIGPNMMWNTKYTFTTGVCNWFRGTPTTTPTVTADQAKANAQQYLDAYYAGTTAGEVTAFYGYYTIEVESNGSVYGMLSVNSYTGQVWFHTWHGSFIQEATIA
jgi:hypothetical protein